MARYRCLLRDTDGFPLEGKLLITDTDAGARKFALGILRQLPHVRNVDVWREADFAFSLSKMHLAFD